MLMQYSCNQSLDFFAAKWIISTLLSIGKQDLKLFTLFFRFFNDGPIGEGLDDEILHSSELVVGVQRSACSPSCLLLLDPSQHEMQKAKLYLAFQSRVSLEQQHSKTPITNRPIAF